MSRTRVLPTTTSALVLCLGLAACGTEGTEPADPTGTSTAAPAAPTTAAPTTDEDAMTSSEQPQTDPAPTTLPVPPSATDLPIGEVPAAVIERPEVQAAVEAEAERTGVEVDAVTVAGYAEVTWRDGSLGCPQPGMMYTQALVPGHQLVLEVDGEYASYHAGRTGTFSYCADPQSPTPGGSGGDI